MQGALLDTHALYWFVSAIETLSEESLISIFNNQSSGTLFVSPISAWELAIASRKPAHKHPPDLGRHSPAEWFSAAIALIGAKIIPIDETIACEAATVTFVTGHRDPGDCYLIATARVSQMAIITRDSVMQSLSSSSYLQIINC